MSVALALLFFSGFGLADERTWLKTHWTIGTVQEGQLAEFTDIMTLDQIQPYLSRFLYGDSTGNLLVIRFSANTTDSTSRTEYTFLGTGEKIAFDIAPPNVTLTRTNGPSITFVDADPIPPEVQSQAASVMEGASQSFKDALRGFAEVTSRYGARLLVAGILLTGVLYPDIDTPSTGSGEELTGKVVGFDPDTTPPNAFEQQFGQAYYQ
jgi:hypothetical protein